MPPEMITIVAPIGHDREEARVGERLHDGVRVPEVVHLAPVRRSTCEPASAMSAMVTSATTMTSPVSCDASEPSHEECGASGDVVSAASAMRQEIGPRGRE